MALDLMYGHMSVRAIPAPDNPDPELTLESTIGFSEARD
jgi:hypothetical protein